MTRYNLNRRISKLAFIIATCALTIACSNGKVAAVKTQDGDTVKAGVERTSSRILEILDVRGKVTETGAMTSRCSDYDSDEEVYRARHPWSIYKAPFADMQKGTDRLRVELPKDGWKIVQDGVDASKRVRRSSRSPRGVNSQSTYGCTRRAKSETPRTSWRSPSNQLATGRNSPP
ncbi:hypothetical protein [Streptomyces sp. NBC_00154]|uniref:hypothetical protein n=1 Tax=Streptomyces sp. NBC_00154 TaxID=2975670 RepID=UPI002254BE0E|nr:hypothetical protein [Streptomyces sp. NBC_00154]MCX5312494.1 hypothetical protein [Streptomyces sp. NBC_00154]